MGKSHQPVSVEEVPDEEGVFARATHPLTGAPHNSILEEVRNGPICVRVHTSSHTSTENQREEGSRILDPLPPPTLDEQFISPSKLHNPPAGMSCIGINALMIHCKLRDCQESTIEGHLDSRADISLIAENTLQSLTKYPKIKTGLKINLYQQTNSAKIIGYVHIPIWTKDLKGRWVKLEVDVCCSRHASTITPWERLPRQLWTQNRPSGRRP